MRFIKASREQAIADLSQRLVTELGQGKVLWIVSGGSNIAAAAKIMSEIPPELTSNLTIMLGDERYGEVGHGNSNWQQLLDTGVDFKAAQTLPVLQGKSFEETLSAWQQSVEQALAGHGRVLVHLGMGADGHISGILPNSPATEEPALVAGYQGPDYKRLTLTFTGLKKATATYLFAYGAEKRPALEALRDQALPLAEQPAQVLKQIGEAYIYNDQIGEPA